MKRQFLLSIFLFLAFITLVCALPCRGQNSDWIKEYPIVYNEQTEIGLEAGTSQAIASLSGRLYVSVQSYLATESMWLSVGTTTAVVGKGTRIEGLSQFNATLGY